MRRARIVVADRHPIVLQGIGSVLSTQSDLAIVASCVDAASCGKGIRLLAPDVTCCDADIDVPHLLALASNAGKVLGWFSSHRVVLFADAADVKELHSSAEDGSCLALTRERKLETLVAPLRKVAHSKRFASLPADPRQVGKEAEPGR